MCCVYGMNGVRRERENKVRRKVKFHNAHDIIKRNGWKCEEISKNN
jgi:hypothetical protein